MAILNQYAYVLMGKTIHSSIQLKSFKNMVDNQSTAIQGVTASITTLDGYVLPLIFQTVFHICASNHSMTENGRLYLMLSSPPIQIGILRSWMVIKIVNLGSKIKATTPQTLCCDHLMLLGITSHRVILLLMFQATGLQ